MNDRTRRALAILAVALMLGIAGDALRTWAPSRLDLALWAAAALLGGTALIRGGALTAPPRAGWLAATAILLIPCLIWRDAEQLIVLDVFGLLGVVVLAATAGIASSLDRLGVFDLLRGAATLGLGTAAGPVPAAAADVAWADMPLTTRTRRVAVVFAGLAAAIPVVLVFGNLFGEADPLFRQTITRVFSFDLARVVNHVAFAGFVAWVAAGALRGALWRDSRGLAWLPALPAGGGVPAGAILSFVGAIGALFALFVGFQAREFFLDSAAFQALTGVTISEYARRGFFELLAVATLTLPMLLGADWLLSRREPAAARWFHRLTATVLVLLALVLVSAYQRMLLYRDYYGLTEQRFYALAFMTWLAVVFGWFAVTVLRDRRPRFLPGALAAGYAALLFLNVVNPDAVVAGVNLDRARHGAPLDVAYLGQLSADAIPTIVAGATSLASRERCATLMELHKRWGVELEASGPSATWNFSRRNAGRGVEAAWEAARACAARGEGQGTEAKL